MKFEDFKKIISKQQKNALTEREEKLLFSFEKKRYQSNRAKTFKSRMHQYDVKNSIQRNIDNALDKRDNKIWLKAVATIAILLGISLVFFTQTGKIFVQSVTVANISQDFKEVKLPDGSVITLNKDSKITYKEDFNEDNRDITLKGEAYFEVSKNKDLPFIVSTGELQTRVVGTAFNIKSGDEDINVTVSEGLVKVYHLKDTLSIKPNEQAIYSIGGESLTKKEVNPMLYSYWFKSDIDLHAVTLSELEDVFKGVYNYRFVYKNKSLKMRKMSLSFNRNESIEQLIDKINLINEVQFIKQHNNMIEIQEVK